MHKLITYLHAAIMGGEKAVLRSLNVFDKVLHGLEVGVQKLEAEKQAQIARHLAAWRTYDKVNVDVQINIANIDQSTKQATAVIDKVNALVQG